MINATQSIWKDGEMVPWADATTHVMSHALHYGSSIFEGIRCYATSRGPVFFRLEDHIDRFMGSAAIYRMPMPFDREALLTACHAVVAENGLDAAYVRPLAFRGYGQLGLDPAETPVSVIVAAVEWGAYHSAGAMDSGISARVVSWQRPAPNTLPSLAKAGGNYLSGQLIAAEAHRDGYEEGIALDTDGFVSEGSGMNIFVAYQGVLLTPPAASSLLPGLTRDAVLHLCRQLSIEVRSERIPRELLLLADEVFLVGTAAEIAPVTSIDRRAVGDGLRGPVTAKLQAAFTDLIHDPAPTGPGYVTPLRQSRVNR